MLQDAYLVAFSLRQACWSCGKELVYPLEDKLCYAKALIQYSKLLPGCHLQKQKRPQKLREDAYTV